MTQDTIKISLENFRTPKPMTVLEDILMYEKKYVHDSLWEYPKIMKEIKIGMVCHLLTSTGH